MIRVLRGGHVIFSPGGQLGKERGACLHTDRLFAVIFLRQRGQLMLEEYPCRGAYSDNVDRLYDAADSVLVEYLKDLKPAGRVGW